MPNKNSILFIVFSLQAGGTQRMILNVLNTIKTNDSKRILYLYNYYPNPGYEIQVPNGVTIYKCETRNIFKHLHRLFLLIKIIRNENISRILSFAKNGAYHAVLARMFFPFRRISVMYRMVSVYTELISSQNKILKRLGQFLYINILCQKVDLIISQSNYMTESFIKENPTILKNKVRTIHNILLYDKIVVEADEPTDIDFEYFVFAGHLSEEKNVSGIIEAYRMLSADTNTKLLIVGEGYLRPKISMMIEDYGLKDKVLLLGYQTNPFKFISKAEALILFSRYEGMPNVVLEAMVCKTPVIVSDFEGVEDLIINNKTGLIVQRDNLIELSNAMNLIQNNTLLKSQMREDAYQFAKDFSEKSIDDYTTLLIK